MKRYDIYENLNNYLESNWTKTDIAWEGLQYNVSGNQSYIKPFLRIGNSEQLEIGGNNPNALDIEDGFYLIQILTPVSQGIYQAQITGESLRSVFRRQSPINGVTIGNTSLKDPYIDDDDERFYLSILIIEIVNFICES